jgi:hypothetical protein
VAGLIYGVYHQSSLNTKAKNAEIDREYKRKESLIEQAKAEWKKKTMPADKKTESGGSMFSLIAHSSTLRDLVTAEDCGLEIFTDQTCNSHYGPGR